MTGGLVLSKPAQNRNPLMARAQVFGQQVQVSLRRGDLGMPEHHRKPDNVAAVAQVVGRERMAAIPSQE
jgi:hypothetical protein